MIAAIDVGLDLKVGARRPGKGPWVCPECFQPVHRRQGMRVAAHFAHMPNATCTYGEGESAAHLNAKQMMADLFAHADCEPEAALSPERRADLVVLSVRGSFVVEIQTTPIDPGEWEQRTRDYNHLGYPVMWIWGSRNVPSIPVPPRAAIRDEHHVRAGMLHAHHESRHVSYVVDDGNRLLACTLGDAHMRPGHQTANNHWLDEYIPATIRRWHSRFPGERDINHTLTAPMRVTATAARNGLAVAEITGDRETLITEAQHLRPPFTWNIKPPAAEKEDDWADAS